MTDNELFSHFKLQSDAFNEAPGDALWAKIESGLDGTKPSARPNTMLFILTGTLLTALAIWYFTIDKAKSETILPAQPVRIVKQAEPENIVINDSPKTVTTVSPANAVPRAFIELSAVAVDLPQPAIAIQDSVKKVRVRTAKMAAEKTMPSSIPFKPFTRKMDKNAITEPLTFEIIKKETLGNIIIITKQKITDAEYLQLIADMLGEYESRPGALLTIKAPGHIPFKKVMGVNHKLTVGLQLDDSIFNPKKLKPTSATLQTESPKLNITTLNPSVITFKNAITKDSLPATNNNISD